MAVALLVVVGCLDVPVARVVGEYCTLLEECGFQHRGLAGEECTEFLIGEVQECTGDHRAEDPCLDALAALSCDALRDDGVPLECTEACPELGEYFDEHDAGELH